MRALHNHAMKRRKCLRTSSLLVLGILLLFTGTAVWYICCGRILIVRWRVAKLEAELKLINPHWNGKVDWSPAQEQKRLLPLFCPHDIGITENNFANLSSLKGLPLEKLWLYNSQVKNITPLKGMPLKVLNLKGTLVSDLTPLRGMKLQRLVLSETNVEDINPLKDMPLTFLSLDNTCVTDITPLSGMRLEYLLLGNTNVSDIFVLKGMPLNTLSIENT